MTPQPSGAMPDLAAGEVYVYSHGNGAILVKYADGRSMLAPLNEVLSVVAGCHAAGHRVVAAWDQTPLATAVIDRIRGAGVPVVAFSASQPPHHWGEGTDALIEAASLGTDGLLDDLIARGADVHHQDDSGSTALHHAAANGSVHALEALVAAGAAVDQANRNGFTPHMLAMACRQEVAAQRLEALGADAASGPVGMVRFRRAHYGTLYVWFAPLILATLAIAFLWPLTLPGVFGVVAYLAVYAAVVPGRAFWAGGVPRQLDGATLTLRGVTGAARLVDLTEVTAAAAGGSARRSSFRGARWLLLAHPDGHRVTRRALRRLLVPADELDALAARMDCVVVVVLDGARRDEVIVPVGNLLSARGVDLSASLRKQLARARGTSERA